VFDVLSVGKLDVRRVPLVDRKRLVERVVARSRGGLREVPCVAGDGRERWPNRSAAARAGDRWPSALP
jgi:hypothetical protein